MLKNMNNLLQTTTPAPTTIAPTTAKATTPAPTTMAPTTMAPTTPAPTTMDPLLKTANAFGKFINNVANRLPKQQNDNFTLYNEAFTSNNGSLNFNNPISDYYSYRPTR